MRGDTNRSLASSVNDDDDEAGPLEAADSEIMPETLILLPQPSSFVPLSSDPACWLTSVFHE